MTFVGAVNDIFVKFVYLKDGIVVVTDIRRGRSFRLCFFRLEYSSFEQLHIPGIDDAIGILFSLSSFL
jgi:hypothetical protein